MPLSIWLGMEDCLQTIVTRRPSAVLDAGIGFGLWGHLLRQYLDVWSGRIHKDQWKTRIDGIEIDAARVQTHAEYLYSHIYIGDIREVVPRRAKNTSYDVILFGDVLEHLPKEDALALLRCSTNLARQLVVVRIPLGDGWREEGREPPDHHRSRWTLDDFMGYTATLRQYDFYGNPYGLIAIETGVTGQPAILADIAERVADIEGRLQQLIGQNVPEN